MALTDKQLENRRNYLCSSDMASLFLGEDGHSLNQRATAMDVYTEKVFELEPKKSTKAQARGNRYESGLIEYAKEELSKPIVTDPERLEYINYDILDKNGKPIFMAHLDGFIEDGVELPEIVEAKTVGIPAEYGEPYTDDIPQWIIIQVHTSFLCTGWKKAWIPVIIGKYGLPEEMYVVERNEKIINSIIERGEQFWNDNILKKIPPPDSEPGNLQLFKRICRIPASYAEIDPMLLTTWETLKETRLNAEKEEDKALAEILKSIGDAEAVLINDGREFTYFEFKSKRVDSQILKKEFPEIYKKVIRENHYRVPRIRKI